MKNYKLEVKACSADYEAVEEFQNTEGYLYSKKFKERYCLPMLTRLVCLLLYCQINLYTVTVSYKMTHFKTFKDYGTNYFKNYLLECLLYV